MVGLNFRIYHPTLLICVFLLIGSVRGIFAQTSEHQVATPQTVVQPESSRLQFGGNKGAIRQLPRRGQIHGSIDGSQPNQMADHPVARLFDRMSEWGGHGCQVYGYVDQGFTWNPASPANRTNGLVMNNYRSNDYQLNAIYFVTERNIDPNLNKIQLGGRLDTVYGTDARFMLTTGLDDKIVTPDASRFYRFAFRQAYLNLFLPIGRGTSIKVGTFVTPIGLESGYAPTNFFYSHVLMSSIQPGTLTGFLADYPLTDNVSIRFGPNFGSGTFEDTNHSVSFAGSVAWTSTDKRTSLQFDFQDGKQRTYVDPKQPELFYDSLQFYYSLILDHQINGRWQYKMEHDLMYSSSGGVSPQDNYQFYTLANYLLYQVNRQWVSGIRIEWLQNDGGPLFGVKREPLAAPGDYYSLTLGLNYCPRPHVRWRPELRYDWQSPRSPYPTDDRPLSYDDYTSAKNWLIACDVLWEF